MSDTNIYGRCGIFEHVALSAFRHRDPDFSLDPLSTNRRFQPYAELAVLGTAVVSGMTADSIHVLIPDCTVPTVGNNVANRSLRFQESGAFGPPQISTVSSRAAVSGMSIASMDLLSSLEPLALTTCTAFSLWLALYRLGPTTRGGA